MFLKKLKDNVVYLDNKYLKSSIINLYLKLKYFLKLDKYIHQLQGRVLKKRKHNLNKELIVSLTSYSKRFGTLPLVLDCLQNQTILPDKIELWIEENDKSLLPEKIYNFKGVDIKFCENGLYSYKKIIPTLKEGDDRFIVTFDDDILYPLNSLEALVTKSKKFPNDIIANRLHEIKLKNTPADISY